MTRWNYVVCRAALFALCIGFSTLAVNPLVRWGIVRSGESIIGARVDVAKVQCALLQGHVTLEGVRAADPRRSQRNLFEVEEARLNIDTDALAQRRIVVTDGQARGFEFGTPRKTSATLPEAAQSEYMRALAEQFAATGQPWLRNAAQLTTADVTEELRAASLSRQLAARWPEEQQRIDSHSAHVRERITQIQKLIDESGDNPLRNLQPYQQAIEELEVLQREGFEITGGMNRVRQQLLMDKSAIDAVRAQDEDYLAQQLQIGSLDGRQLSEYLLGPEVNELVGNVLNWVRLGRKQVPTGSGIPLGHRDRGEFIYFPGIEPTPTTVVHRMAIAGSGTFGGRPVAIEGVVRGLTSHPQLAKDPVEVEVTTVDGPHMTIQASLDMSGEVPHDQIAVHCPSLPCARRTLGQVGQLAVHVSPGTNQISIRIEIVGDAIDGEVIVSQQGVSLAPRLDPSFVDDQIGGLIASSLTGVDQIETRARLTGTADAPVMELESSLGPALAAGITGRVQEAVCEAQRRGLREKYREIDAMIAELDQLCEQKSQELTAQAETRRDQIEQIQEIIATRVERNDGVTNEDWPLRETFRR